MTGPINPGQDPARGGYGAADPASGGYTSGGAAAGGTNDPLTPGASAPTQRFDPARSGPGRHTSGDEPVQTPPRQPWNAGIADPGPLGLTAFATTTMVLSVFNSGLLDAGGTPAVFGLAFFYGGLAQLLAGMWEFVKGNTFGAVAFTSYGAFWLSFWYLEVHAAAAITGNAADAVGVYLLGWTLFTAYMTIAALRTTGVITVVFALLTLTFLLLTIGEFATSTGVHHAGGYVGLATAVAAWYGSFAGVTNATFRKTVLPTFPMNP